MKQLREPTAERTNIVLDSKLVEWAKRLATVKTIRDALDVALEYCVRSGGYSGVLALRGAKCGELVRAVSMGACHSRVCE